MLKGHYYVCQTAACVLRAALSASHDQMECGGSTGPEVGPLCVGPLCVGPLCVGPLCVGPLCVGP